MAHLRLLRAAAVAWLAACGGSPDATPDKSAAGADTGECTLLTAAEVQEVTGVAVSRIERNPSIGAGGTCDNFTTPDGQVYLGVNRLNSQDAYASAVSVVPEDLYPTRSPVAGLGDEAVLFQGPGGLRYLAARKGDTGVVLIPLGQGFQMTDDQLRELASRALAAAG
ncbi:MAG TPA: hypothetical protein VMN37_07305 [Gemmatimonadales bacterium]|nr:hypothetical protein [Gemmatimonadales bacterium]